MRWLLPLCGRLLTALALTGVVSGQVLTNGTGQPILAGGSPIQIIQIASPQSAGFPRIFGYAESGGALSAYVSANWTTYAPLYNALVYANYVGGTTGGATFAAVMAATKSASTLTPPPFQGYYLQAPFQACAFQGTGTTSGTALTIQSSNTNTCPISISAELYSVSGGNPVDTGFTIASGSGSSWVLTGSPGLASGTSIAIVGGNQATFAKWSMLVDTGTGSIGWWVRSSWPNGSIVDSSQASTSGDLLLSPNNTGTNANGRTLYGEFAYHFDQWYTQGNAVGEIASTAANPTLNLFFLDNQYARTREAGTFGAPSDTTSYAAGNATAAAYLQRAQALQVAALRTQHSGIIVAGNSNYYLLGTASGNNVALDPSNVGLYDFAFAEGVEQSMGSYNAATLFAMLEQQEAQVSTNGALVVGEYYNGTGSGCPSVVSWTSAAQGSWGANQWQVWRAGAAMTYMRNAYWAPGVGANNVLWWGDELGQPTTSGAGWLSKGTQRLDPPQTGPATQVTLTGTGNVSGVYVRRLPNGWVIWNPYGNGSVTITNIPTTLFHIADPFGGQSGVNTGAQVSGGSVTLGDTISSQSCGDGLFLIGTGMNIQPAANDDWFFDQQVKRAA